MNPANPAAEKMVREQLIPLGRGIDDPQVIQAMRHIPRELFVPEHMRASAYEDRPLPIGNDQTISQPFVVAYMTQALLPLPGDRVLEIGTGSGYQTAVLAEIFPEIYSVELTAELSSKAQDALGKLNYRNIRYLVNDGRLGWPEHAPYSAVIVTCAAPTIPQALLDQLADQGRMILPVGTTHQQLVRVVRDGNRFEEESLLPVRFVPLR